MLCLSLANHSPGTHDHGDPGQEQQRENDLPETRDIQASIEAHADPRADKGAGSALRTSHPTSAVMYPAAACVTKANTSTQTLKP